MVTNIITKEKKKYSREQEEEKTLL